MDFYVTIYNDWRANPIVQVECAKCGKSFTCNKSASQYANKKEAMGQYESHPCYNSKEKE